MKVELPRIQSPSLWDQAYNILKDCIIKRQFKPNQKLSAAELSERLGISNTPIRDALIHLEMEGLVTTVSNVGTFVNPINVENVTQTMNTRLMLEYWVADHISELPKDYLASGIAKLEENTQSALEKINTVDLKNYISSDYNFRFHLEFMKLGENPMNVKIYSSLMQYRYVLIGTSIESYETKSFAIEQHQCIVNALKSGSIVDIKRTIREHLEESKRRLLFVIEQNGGEV